MDVVCGCGHMWFLPMLFWIFLLTYCILLIKQRWLRWGIVIVLCIVSIVPMPLRISNAFDYIAYFYAGYEAMTYHKEKCMKCFPIALIPLIWAIFAAIFVLLTIAKEYLPNWYCDGCLVQKAIGITGTNLISKIYGFAGIFSLFFTSIKYICARQLNSVIINLGTYCFGVYLFQQFILKALYYLTSIPSIIGSQWLPWIGFIFALALSVLLSFLFKQTYLGRKLI